MQEKCVTSKKTRQIKDKKQGGVGKGHVWVAEGYKKKEKIELQIEKNTTSCKINDIVYRQIKT